MTFPHPKSWLSAPDLARQAGVSENTARRWIKQHSLGRKVGGRWRADLATAAEFAALPLQAKTGPEAVKFPWADPNAGLNIQHKYTDACDHLSLQEVAP